MVVGDHGEMLGEHGEQTHGFFVYEAGDAHPADHRPVRACRPRVVSDQVRIVDVMPTALRCSGCRASEGGAGREPDAAGPRRDGSTCVAHSESWYPRYHYGWSELRAVQDGRFKY